MKPNTKSWKTTLLGCVIAAWVVIEPMINSEEINWKTILKAGIIAVAGFLVKDWNVTGTGGDK